MRNRKKVMRKSDLEYIPLHLCEEILARLPVKDLLRFRCVCKSWRSIIDSSVFTHMHLKLYKNNHRKNNLVLCAEPHRENHTLCLRHINKFRRIGEQIELLNIFKFNIVVELCLIFGSCKGLLLIKNNVLPEETRLWNFSIRKSLLLPHCPIWDDVTYVVGFAPSINDYKVVAFTYDLMAVYSLRDHCWKVKNNTMFMNPKWHVRELCFRDVVFVEKVAYWFEFSPSYYKEQYQQNRIVSFDFDAEEINLLELPDQVTGKEIIAKFLCNIDDSLAVFSWSIESTYVLILEKDRGNGKVLWRSWYYGETNVDFGKNHEIRHLRKIFYGDVDTYVESLVSHTDSKWSDAYIYPRKVRKNSRQKQIQQE